MTSCTGPISAMRPAYMHRDAVRRLGDHAHVVGDQHHGRAVVSAEVLQQRDDLRLHGDVKRRGRLVGDRPVPARRRAPGRSRRAGACRRRTGADRRRCAFSGAGMPTSFRRSMRAACVPARSYSGDVGLDRLDQLLADRVERVQRWSAGPGRPCRSRWPRILRISSGGRLSMRSPFKQDLAAGDAAGRLQQADDGGAGQRLAGAGFAHDAEDLTGGDVEGDVDRRLSACRGGWGTGRRRSSDRKGRARSSARHLSFGLRASRSQSPSRLIGTAPAAPGASRAGKNRIHHSPENRYC